MPLWTPGFVSKSILTAWLKAENITGVADGVGVATWNDSSGNGRTFSQGTGINRPLFRTNQINGNPALQFVSNDSINSTLVSGSLMTEGFACVFKRDVLATNDIIIDSASGGRMLYVSSFNSLRLMAEASTAIGVSGNDTVGTGWTIASYRLTPTTYELAVNGAILASGSHAVTFTPGLTTLIGEGPGSGNGLEGFISELVFFDGADAATIRKTEGYLAWKYGITLAGGHPYVSSAPVVARSGMVAVV